MKSIKNMNSPQKQLLDQVRQKIRIKHYSIHKNINKPTKSYLLALLTSCHSTRGIYSLAYKSLPK